MSASVYLFADFGRGPRVLGKAFGARPTREECERRHQRHERGPAMSAHEEYRPIHRARLPVCGAGRSRAKGPFLDLFALLLLIVFVYGVAYFFVRISP